MANPIRRAGFFDYDFGSENEGRRQDQERQQGEDEAYFQRTGIRRPPIPEYSPLVDQNPSSDVANDGDSYIEDNPSHIIVDANNEEISRMISGNNLDHNGVPDEDLDFRILTPRIDRQSIMNTLNKEEETKKQKENEEFQKLLKERQDEIGNAIEGLDEK